MFCQSCGAKLPEDASFCEICGARIPAPEPATAQAAPRTEAPRRPNAWQRPEPSARPNDAWQVRSDNIPAPPVPPRQKPSPNIELCSDGVYRWIHEYSMLKNPVIFMTILKIFALVCGLIFLIGLLSNLGGTEAFGEKLWNAALPALIALGVVTVLTIPSYLIVAKSYGWKYIVVFEMDDHGITHTQEDSQFTKAEGMAWLAAMVGAAAGSHSAAGAGMLAASRNSMTSEFDKVRSVKSIRRWNTIKVNQPLAKNQVYTAREDYDFVLNYILARIPPTAKRSGR